MALFRSLLRHTLMIKVFADKNGEAGAKSHDRVEAG